MPDRRPRPYLVCYDIRDPDRLRRVHRCMREWGLPLQYSVFYCRLRPQGQRRLQRALQGLIDERVDDIRIYCLRDSATITFQGVEPIPEGLILEGLRLERDENDSQHENTR